MPKPPSRRLKPYWTTADNRLVRLYHGNVEQIAGSLPRGSVHTIVTSPPYHGLRDYNTDKTLEVGAEPTAEEYIARMVSVFRALRRVLRDDGTVWLNLGDSYGPNGQLKGVPWRVALALQNNGWVLRQDIIWAKPNCMPESVRNRCTKSHEYLFLLAKRSGYYYDNEAIREDGTGRPWNPKNDFGADSNRSNKSKHLSARQLDLQRTQFAHNTHHDDMDKTGRSKRSVWWVAPATYPGAHYATFPARLIEPCILAGTSERGCCPRCGKPWKRIVERGEYSKSNRQAKRKGGEDNPSLQGAELNCVGGGYWPVKTVGWQPGCKCKRRKPVPCVVLDPFVGSGTTCCVALANGRRSVGIDLSADYLATDAVPRITGELLARPRLAHQAGHKRAPVKIGKSIA